jgi:hypothetical protein
MSLMDENPFFVDNFHFLRLELFPSGANRSLRRHGDFGAHVVAFGWRASDLNRLKHFLPSGVLRPADLGEDRPGQVLGSLLEERPGMALSLFSGGPVPRGNA